MKKNILTRLIYAFALIIGLTGCKAKKLIVESSLALPVETTVVKSDTNKKDKLSSIFGKDLIFNTLSFKTKAVLRINEKNNDVNMSFRMHNNEAIWVSVTALAGVEVVRALITPDSVKLLNRLDNIYINKPFEYIHEFTNEQINFKTLQSVLVGNTITEFISDSTDLNMETEEAKLKTVLGTLIYNLKVNSSNKVVLTNLNDEDKEQELSVNYSDFKLIAQQEIPHTIILDSKAKKKEIWLELKFLKVDLDTPLELPFRVPERFLIKN